MIIGSKARMKVGWNMSYNEKNRKYAASGWTLRRGYRESIAWLLFLW